MKPAALIVFLFIVFLLPVNGLSYCVEGDCQDGQGTMITSDGGKYVGEFKDGLPNGQGILTYSDGEKYEGNFKDGWRHGQGTLTYPDGYQYVGEWKDGERHGYGVESYPGSDDKEGSWMRDMYVGKKIRKNKVE